MPTLLRPLRVLAAAVCLTTFVHADAIDSLEGPVTPSEIQSFKDLTATLPRAADNIGNNLVYGRAGTTAEALGIMYEVTHDPELLDRLVVLADEMLAARNDPENGRTIWTGNRELCWPNKKPDAPGAPYSGTENGDVLAHIAFAAKLILADKSTHARTVPDPHHFGATLLDRARTYVRECDRTVDTFLLPYFVREGSNLYHFPNDARYGTIDDRSKTALDKPVPWNQQMMLNGGLQRLAECHELLNDAPERVARYDAIVRASLDAFFADVERYDVDGHPCYKWTYGVGERPMKHIEDGGHANYDLLIFRSADRYHLTRDQLLPFGNTIRYVMHRPDGTFAWRVDGATEGKAAPPRRRRAQLPVRRRRPPGPVPRPRQANGWSRQIRPPYRRHGPARQVPLPSLRQQRLIERSPTCRSLGTPGGGRGEGSVQGHTLIHNPFTTA